MPFTSESLPFEDRHEFCRALKAARQRQGIGLDAIERSTKIPAFLFEGLERGDLRRWPNGLFRRSFFRDYARMIGVPVAAACDEFARLFPDQEGAHAAPTAGAGAANAPGVAVRLAIDPEWHGPRQPLVPRVLAAVLDLATVAATSALLAWATPWEWPTVAAVAAITYYSVATVVFGGSPASWAMARRCWLLEACRKGRDAVQAFWTPTAPAPVEPESRPWFSDAHRVGPPRLRVRLKAPQ